MGPFYQINLCRISGHTVLFSDISSATFTFLEPPEYPILESVTPFKNVIICASQPAWESGTEHGHAICLFFYEANKNNL